MKSFIYIFLIGLSTSLLVNTFAKPKEMSRYYRASGSNNTDLVNQLKRKMK